MKRKNRDTPGRRIAQAIIAQYMPKSVAEMQAALKEVFGPMFEAILNGEMESYLGYEPNSREEKETTNRRNGYFDKNIKTSMGETEIEVPRDRQASFDSVILPKHKRDYETKECAVYNILGIRVDGRKEILGLWIQDSESKHAWMQIFDELKSRGVQEVGFISMDGVSGLEEGARAIFPEVVVQRCIVHPIRNSLEYVPTRDYKDFTAHLKKFMVQRASKLAASNLSGSARSGVNIPVRLVSAVRKIMYTGQFQFSQGNQTQRISQ